MHFGSITGREPRGDRAPTRIFPDEIASRPQLTAPSVFGISPASAQDPKDTNRLKKKYYDACNIRANAAGPLSVSGLLHLADQPTAPSVRRQQGALHTLRRAHPDRP